MKGLNLPTLASTAGVSVTGEKKRNGKIKTAVCVWRGGGGRGVRREGEKKGNASHHQMAVKSMGRTFSHIIIQNNMHNNYYCKVETKISQKWK